MNFYDTRGTLIEIGQKVAYNFSGEIAVGIVESIKVSESARWSGTFMERTPRIKIKQLFPEQYRNQRTSLVKNARSLLVLKEDKYEK